MRYDILGPLRVVDGPDHSFITARKVEVLLTVLLVRADQVVTPGQLMVEIWGDDPPRRASAGLHVYISQLRKFLHRPGRPANPIVTQQPGYLLRKGADELDFETFLTLMDRGRILLRDGHHEEAADSFQRAADLWRGPMRSDMRIGPIVEGFVTWLAEARLECHELLAEALLQLGQHRELTGRLYALSAENPLRETFYRQLMLALYRSERQADALRVYQTARKKLHDELGLEPCRALRELHHAILRDDGCLTLLAVS